MCRYSVLQALLRFFLFFFLCEYAHAATDSPTAQGHKILFVTSNQHTYGTTKISAANHFEEIVIAYDVFRKSGYVVDFVSPQGGAIPLGYLDTSNAVQKEHLYNPAFMNLLKNTLRPGQVKAADYQAVYYSGGGSAMFGIAENKEIQDIAAAIHARGGVVSAICHGTAGIVNLKGKDGKSLFSNRKVTGFPDSFEDTSAAYYKTFPFSIDKEVTKNGGQFVYSKKWADNFFVVDGRIVTGQDPSATAAVAREVIKAVGGGEGMSTHAFDKIFSDVDSLDKPAVAVALFRNGKLIYEKAFGSVSLEHKLPATVDTKFQVDTLAWEFVAFSALLLESQGKLKLSDDVRKYVPELPDLGHKITVDHLLSSTDGVYGYKVLQALAGWEARGPGQHAAILALMKSQKQANFKPGSAFSPGGDTRFVLLAKVVEVVSGQSFDAFSRDHIFAPLGMANTSFVYDDGQRLDNKAVPYRDAGNGVYQVDDGGGRAPGPLNLYTSIRDLSLWRANLASPRLGGKSLAAKLTAPLKLDGGTVIRDISGVSTYGQQHAGQERGIAKTYQMGNFGGYASSFFRFPDHDISVVVLSSGLAYNGSYGMRLASILLEDQYPEPLMIDYAKVAAVKLPVDQLRQFEGSYWSPDRALAANVQVKDGVLVYSRVGGAQGRELIPQGGASFRMKIEGDDHYFIRFVDTPAGRHMHFIMGASDPVVFHSYQPASYTDSELAQFTGTFHSEELDSSFVLAIDKGMLTARNLRAGEISFKPVDADTFTGNKPFMGGIKFQRAENRGVTGFQVVVDEVRHLEFKKIPGPAA